MWSEPLFTVTDFIDWCCKGINYTEIFFFIIYSPSFPTQTFNNFKSHSVSTSGTPHQSHGRTQTKFVQEHAYVISKQSRRALQWERNIWDVDGPVTNTLSVHDQLLRLHQGRASVTEYALKFRTLAANCG